MSRDLVKHGNLTRSPRETAKASGSELAAHGHAEPDELLGLLRQCEAVLRDRHPQHAVRWDDLLEWESTPTHVDDGPSASCVTCRRARRHLFVSEASA